MLRLPSLLKTSSHGNIPERTFLDLQFAKHFSPQTRRILAHPCDRETIRLRQETFRALNEERCHRLRELLPLLARLAFLEEGLSHREDTAGGIFLQCSRMEALLQAAELLRQDPPGPLFERIRDALEEEEIRELLHRIQSAATECRGLLNRISCIDVGHGLLPGTERESETETMIRCSAAMGYDISPRRNRPLSLGKTEPEYRRAFEDTLRKAESLLAPYRTLNLQDMIEYGYEIRFFLEIRDLCEEAEKRGIPHCYPGISDQPTFVAKDLYDITMIYHENNIIPNDAWFSEEEPFFFLTGANGGGKTTYLRAVGANLILATAGCPIFATDGKVYPFATVLSHFPEDERFVSGGRLENELKRAEKILSSDKDAFLLFNESFSSTDEFRGGEELQNVGDTVRTKGFSGLCVTHFHQVSELGFPLLSTVVAEGGTGHSRTFRIRKREGEKKSFAVDILKKYGLDGESLRERRVSRETKPIV